MHIAQEESKFGLDPEEAIGLVKKIAAGEFGHIYLKGLMGMSTFTNDQKLVQNEFKALHELYQRSQMILPHLDTLSMGMSGDFKIALAEGSTMIRVGSLLFGERNYN